MRKDDRLKQRVAEMLRQSGWLLDAASGPRAIAEASVGAVRVDFALYVDDRLLAVVELKRTVSDISAQQLASILDRASQTQSRSDGGTLVGYVSNGRETMLVSSADARREVAGFHTPEGLLRLSAGRAPWLAELSSAQAPFASRLAPHQVEAVRAIEESLLDGERRLLLAVAAGAGRTGIAAAFIDRLLRCTSARRVLVLADSRLMGEQFRTALADFETSDGRRLGEDYDVHIADRLQVDIHAPVLVTSAARLQHIASRELRLPVDHFDLIWTDEPESLTDSTWQQVLDRFDAPLVGITSRPTPETFSFFDGNLVAAIDIDQLLLSGRRAEVNRDVVDVIWQRVQARRGHGSLEEALAGSLLEGSPAFTWRELIALLDQLGSHAIRPLPEHLVEFVAEYLRGRGVAFALDPAASNPALLSAVVEVDGAEGAHGQAIGPLSWQLSQGLLSDFRLSWSPSNDGGGLAAPLMQPGLIVCAPPFGLREVEAEIVTAAGRAISLRDRTENIWGAPAVPVGEVTS